MAERNDALKEVKPSPLTPKERGWIFSPSRLPDVVRKSGITK